MTAPRLPLWFVGLFAEADQRDAILGDFHEEFGRVAAAHGVRSARRWCWGQAVRTIVHLIAAEGGTRVGIIALTAFGAYVLLGGATAAVHYGERAILSRWQVYYYIDPYSYQLTFEILNFVLVPLLVGLLLATAARRREVLTATILAALIALLGGVAVIRLAVAWHLPYPSAFLTHQHRIDVMEDGGWVALRALSVLAGARLVQKARSATSLPPSNA